MRNTCRGGYRLLPLSGRQPLVLGGAGKFYTPLVSKPHFPLGRVRSDRNVFVQVDALGLGKRGLRRADNVDDLDVCTGIVPKSEENRPVALVV
jgi:hypothetical protein